MSRGHCILSHGFESGPDATKVTALAEVAERLGFSHERPDYTDLDGRQDISRVGDVPARALFLMVPPTTMGPMPALDAAKVPISVVHAWHDELIPAAQVIAWAQQRSARLLMVDDGHRLARHVQASAQAFESLLRGL
jgi:hypothetical protein